MIRIAIIGTGNVAQQLFTAFHSCEGLEIALVYGRSLERLAFFSEFTRVTTEIDAIHTVDVVLICVSDDAIAEVVNKLPQQIGIVAHTSGSIPLDILKKFPSHGVFYPLQTFTKGKTIDFKSIPLCIEANSNKAEQALFSLASYISTSVQFISTLQRKELHVSAVLVNNFTNHLCHIAQQRLAAKDIDFKLLLPLLNETVAKLTTLSAYKAQTGPAKRNDVQTMNAHLEQIKESRIQDIYTLLSNSIQETYGTEL